MKRPVEDLAIGLFAIVVAVAAVAVLFRFAAAVRFGSGP